MDVNKFTDSIANQKWKDTIRLVGRENDRAAVLIGVAYLESRLEELILQQKVNDTEFFSNNGLFPTLDLKIRIAYSFGWISKEAADEMNALRKIRNKFAHDFSDINFETSPIRDWIHSVNFDAEELNRYLAMFGNSTFSKDFSKLKSIFLIRLFRLDVDIQSAIEMLKARK